MRALFSKDMFWRIRCASLGHALIERHVAPVRSDIFIRGTHDLAGVDYLFQTMRAPAYDACNGKYGSEQLDGQPEHLITEAALWYLPVILSVHHDHISLFRQITCSHSRNIPEIFMNSSKAFFSIIVICINYNKWSS